MISVTKNIIKVLLFVIPAIVLIVPDGMFFPFITGRGFLFRVIIEIALGLYAGLCLIDRSYLPKKNALTISVVSLLVIMFIADLLAPYSFKALWSNFERMEGFVAIAHLGVFFLITSSVFSLKEWKKFFFVSLGVATFLGYYGALQMLGILDIHQGSTRIDATLGNAAYFATYLMFHFFFLLFLFVTEGRNLSKGIGASVFGGSLWFILFFLYQSVGGAFKASSGTVVLFIVSIILIGISSYLLFGNRKQNTSKLTNHISDALYILSGLMLLVLIYYTATRGAILGLIGGLIVSSVYILWKEKEDIIARRLSASILIFTVVIVVGFYSIKNTTFVQNSEVLSRFSSLSLDTKGQARSYIWPMAIKGVVEKPLLGWGQDGFIYVFSKYYDPRLWNQEPWFDRAHNSFLDWMVAGGILGFLAYVSIYISGLWLILKAKVPAKEKGLFLGLLGAYSFQALFVFDNLVSYIFFFSLISLVSSLYSPVVEGEKKVFIKDENQSTVIGVSLVVSLVLVYFVNANGYFQNTTLISALRVSGMKDGDLVSCVSVTTRLNEKKEVERVCNKYESTLSLFKKALEYNSFGTPEVVVHLLNTSYSINNRVDVPNDIKSKFAEAIINEFNKQIKIDPLDLRPTIFLGSYFLDIGLLDEAERYILEASKVSPTRQTPYLRLGEIYLNKKDKVKAIEYFKKAYDLDNSYPEAAYLYTLSLVYTGKISEAEVLFPKIINSDRDIAPALIETMVKGGYTVQAQKFLNQRIEVWPQKEDGYMLLSSIYFSLGNKIKAASIIKDMIAKNPSLKEKGEEYLKNIGN